MKDSASSGAVPHVTRVGLIGDVHTERLRLEGVLAHFKSLALDAIVCTGDVPDGPNDARAVDACCALLAGSNVLTISGNHDRWLQDGEMRDLPGATDRDELAAASLAFLAALPPTRVLATPLGNVLLCHGMGSDDMHGVQPYDRGYALETNAALQAILREERYAYVLAGHTHRSMVRTVSNLTLINAGTLLTGQNPCCAVLDFGARKAQFYDVGERGEVTAGEPHLI